MSEEDTDKGLKPELTENGLPVVNQETINALQADVKSGQHTTAEWTALIEKEQPTLIKAMKSLAVGHGDDAPVVFRDLVITYMALRKQAKSNQLSTVIQIQKGK